MAANSDNHPTKTINKDKQKSKKPNPMKKNLIYTNLRSARASDLFTPSQSATAARTNSYMNLRGPRVNSSTSNKRSRQNEIRRTVESNSS